MYELSGSVQSKSTKKGKEYLYTVIYVPHLGRQKWEATGLEAKGNIKKAEKILKERLAMYEQQERELKEATMKAQKKVEQAADDIRFVDWVVKCVENNKSAIRASTAEGYDYQVKHITDYFGDSDITLSQINGSHIEDFVQYLLRSGKVNKKTGERSGLSIRTVRSVKTHIVTALNKAVTRNLIKGNPALSVKVGRKSNGDCAKKMNFMLTDELNDFLEFMENKNDEMLDFVTVTAYYGLRRSEVLGLYLGKDSVDLENRRLHITRTVVKMKNLHDEDDTKTYDSYREFPITDEMYEFFQNVVKKKEEARKFYGNTYYESKSLFTWEDGRPFAPDYLVHHFEKLVKEYGRPNFTLHNLRHSCASRLIPLGWSETEIMSWLGHSDYATTHKWYIVMQKAYMDEKAQTLNGVIKVNRGAGKKLDAH